MLIADIHLFHHTMFPCGGLYPYRWCSVQLSWYCYDTVSIYRVVNAYWTNWITSYNDCNRGVRVIMDEVFQYCWKRIRHEFGPFTDHAVTPHDRHLPFITNWYNNRMNWWPGFLLLSQKSKAICTTIFGGSQLMVQFSK
jgi:hypothetical protein